MHEPPDNQRAYLGAVERADGFLARPTVANVDTQTLMANVRVVQRAVGDGVRVLAVVKADAYGHGAVRAGRAFLDAGAWGLAVSLVEEGVQLRAAGITAPIVVLGGASLGSEPMIVACGLQPVVWEPGHLDRLAAAARAADTRCPVHVQVDTGMGRLGCLATELPELLDVFTERCADALELAGAMTHLACADEQDPEPTRRQLAGFKRALETFSTRGLDPTMRHVNNSAGIVRATDAHYDGVRPGIALYGFGAVQDVHLPGVAMAIEVESRLVGVRELPAGSGISYGHTQTLTRDSRLGVVPVGYEDGYARSMSGQAFMLVHEHRCPVVGRITMDTCMIDLTDVPEARSGDLVTLMGEQGSQRIDAYDLARWAGVIPYEILCGFSKRVPRR